EGYNNAFLTDSDGIQCFDPISDFMEINENPSTRFLKIEITDKGFPDIMNYWGMNGTTIVNSKVKKLIQEYYGKLAIQFFPCICNQFKEHKIELWLLNVCEYYDVLDLNKSICKKNHNLQGEEVIRSVKKYAFKKEAFDLDIFKIYLGSRKHTTCLFVSDRFKEIMEENNVTGLALEKVYSI
ncbi:MAG: imm11 family protein, partial [Oscillospiraceae bacterium]